MIERYSEDTVEAVRRRMQIAIEERQKERTLTKRESVVALQEEIQTMRAAGYSLTEIAGLFSEEGITLAPETVRDYVRPQPRKKGSAKPRDRARITGRRADGGARKRGASDVQDAGSAKASSNVGRRPVDFEVPPDEEV